MKSRRRRDGTPGVSAPTTLPAPTGAAEARRRRFCRPCRGLRDDGAGFHGFRSRYRACSTHGYYLSPLSGLRGNGPLSSCATYLWDTTLVLKQPLQNPQSPWGKFIVEGRLPCLGPWCPPPRNSESACPAGESHPGPCESIPPPVEFSRHHTRPQLGSRDDSGAASSRPSPRPPGGALWFWS